MGTGGGGGGGEDANLGADNIEATGFGSDGEGATVAGGAREENSLFNAAAALFFVGASSELLSCFFSSTAGAVTLAVTSAGGFTLVKGSKK